MNLALAIGTLLVGQMFDPNFDPSKPPPGQLIEPLEQEPGPSARPEPRGWRALGGRLDLPPLTRLGTSTRRQGTAQEPRSMPVAPTEASPESLWTPPTGGGSSAAPPGFGTRMGAGVSGSHAAHAGGAMLPSAPGASRPPGPSLSDLIGARQAAASRMGAFSRPTAPVAQQAKPFAGYTPPPTTSAYMNMYRANQGQIENYTTLVRPELQAQQQNQRFGGDIRGLQSLSRVQQHALQRLGKVNQSQQIQQGFVAPEYFNNYQMYYPNFYR